MPRLREEASAVPASPQPPHAIGGESLFVRNENEIIKHGLGDQQAIEWIAMRPRQRARRLSMKYRDRQAKETLALDHPDEVVDDWARSRELTQPIVEISQIEAALTKTGSNSSFMASRARTLSFSSPANHQRKASVSRRSRVTLLPFGQLGLGHGLEELRPDAHKTFERAELALGRRRIDGREACDWSSAPSDDDFFSGLNSREKLGKIGLRCMDGDDGHQMLRG